MSDDSVTLTRCAYCDTVIHPTRSTMKFCNNGQKCKTAFNRAKMPRQLEGDALLSVRTSRTIEGVEYRVKSDDINTWIAADRRLVELSAYSDAERAELLEEDVVSSVEQSADELKAAAEQEWSKFPLWHAWEESLESGFGIKDLTDRIRRIVCDEFTRANLSPYAAESFNEIRRRLVAREIFPARPDGEPALTLDERMAAATENYNLSDPVQKKAWCHEMGRLRALLGEQ